MTPKVFITGRSGVGKTTLVKAMIERLGAAGDDASPLHGFYTAELLEGNKRAGFTLNILGAKEPLDRKPKIFAHVNFSGAYRVGKYGVDLQIFEECALPVIEDAAAAAAPIIIDEIGKMELLSIRFKRRVLKALDSASPLLATVMSKPHPFIDELRQRPEITWINLTDLNRAEVADELVELFSSGVH